jgi:D-lactate dehydrogenase (cytochrome)
VNAPLPPRPDRTAAVTALAVRFGDALSVHPGVRDGHGRGEGMSDAAAPDAVLFARSTPDVADAVAICAAHGLPVIAHGAGTSLEGQLLALQGGLSIDLTPMDRILGVNADDLDCHVEAGVTREGLNAHLRDTGLFFPLDPGANATLGGMAATRASGTNAVRYGTMREVVLGLTVVTPHGEVITTGGRARKSSAGYDLTRLYVGSEGTLGVITELRLRLFGVPETIVAAVVQFDALDGAVTTVTQTLQMGVPMARIELLDALQMEACIRWSKLDGLAAAPTLFLEFHGSPAAVAEQVETVAALAAGNGGGALASAATQEERSRLWKARHEAYHAARALAPGKAAFATDACVPIAALGEAIREAQAKAAELRLVAPIVGHVGDGNFHMLVLHDPADADELARADALTDAVAMIALAHGGTITGEHGVGVHKLAKMAAEHGAALGVMAAIKRALDPAGIMNPGKTVPAAASTEHC